MKKAVSVKIKNIEGVIITLKYNVEIEEDEVEIASSDDNVQQA